MIITLCVKCRCVTSLTTESILRIKTVTNDPTKFMAVVCAACNDDSSVENYNDTISPDDIASMQEWKYIIDYASSQRRTITINAVGDHVVVFDHHRVIPPAVRVLRSQPIVTCRQHSFHVHNISAPPRIVSSTRAREELYPEDDTA
jgi:hypothetical protein